MLEYIFDLSLVDNIFITDTITASHPGRMSLATASGFTFFGIGLTGLMAKNSNYRKFAQYAVLSTTIIAFISIVTFVLQIPTESKSFFFKTMSIQTSISFTLITFLLGYKFPDIGFTKMLLGNYYGSESLRKLTPFIVFIPFILSFLLLHFISNEQLDAKFGIILYTMVLIFLSFFYTYIISVGLNKSDIQRKILENSLVAKNQELSQFKDALEKIAIIAITDKNAIIKYVNDSFCTISQFSREEIIGNTDKIVRSNHHPISFHKNILAVVSSGSPWFGEVKNKAKDGSFYWTDTAIVPFMNKFGEVYKYMAIKLDITKKKEAEELLSSKYVKKLEDKNKELEQFSYIASHDLQEPLRTITSFSNILYSEYNDKLDDQAKQIFTFIKQATDRMSSLIKNLLDYSRIGHKEKFTEVNCNLLLEDISTDLTTLITKTNTTLKFKNLPIVEAYPTEFRLLFQNLISNAIKFSKKGTPPIIQIKATNKKHGWEFSVKDNGIGIAKEFKKKIFTIFQRLHVREEYEGVGIGLAHCRKVVHLHGGEIWVKSKPNEGSTFYFTISNEKI
ncbi:sensor histidine kinase [Polaribacter huanghezhanensis]|uniref:sensor histidine kinase n=1 Tax=Polaribacter huanghezhanensis TaxID=1354726 RepID=UPI0026474D34|nr:ATP-binding protein [Polaribacter huanghezhanensis]